MFAPLPLTLTTGTLTSLDLSIPPENVGANTNHTAILIGEKGADIIAKELGLNI
jgi:alcohol oxidase